MSPLVGHRARRRCGRVVRRIQRFVDGQLGPAAAQEVAEHLVRCPACCHDARVWRGLMRRLRELRGTADPGSLLRLEELVDHLAVGGRA